MLYLIIGLVLLLIIFVLFKAEQPGCGCLLLLILIFLVLFRFFPSGFRFVVDLIRVIFYKIKEIITPYIGDIVGSLLDLSKELMEKIF